MKAAQQPRRRWIAAVAAYTVAGSISAAAVGGVLGAIGEWVHAVGLALGGDTRPAWWLVSILALAGAAREAGWLNFRLPEWHRQTESYWANEFGIVVAAAMWGADIGLGFTTWVKYAGFWIVAITSAALGDPAYGAGLMLAYWFGRIAPVAIAPLVVDAVKSREASFRRIDLLFGGGQLFRRMQSVGLLWWFGVTLLMAWGITEGSPLAAWWKS